MDIRERVKQLSEERGWSGYKTASESGIPYSTYYRMMKGFTVPQIDTIERICVGLSISMSEFFNFEKCMENREELDFFGACREMDSSQRELVKAYVQAIVDAKRQIDK